ncbi:MAG TPA: DsbA family protein [bacterium]|nr:DsbA family protein [bacterium]
MQLRRLFAASLALAAVGFAGCADPNAKISGPGSTAAAGGGTAASTGGSGEDALPAVVASADGLQITAAEVDAATAAQVFEQRQQIFEARANWAQNELAKRLIKREAEKAGMTFDDYLARNVDNGRSVSDADVKMFYQSNPQMMKKPDGTTAGFDEMKEKIRQYLEQQSKMQGRQQYVAKLMEENHAKVDLNPPEPPVVNVSVDDDPAKGGPVNAPVTVIEFSDFQCPACRQAFQHLDEVLGKYGDKVHFVYRDYPLTGKHPNAFPAAIAANCVRTLGGDDKYWQFNTKLFQNQGALGPDDLKKYATDLKVDGGKYSACLTDPKMADEVKKDMEAGDAAGVNSTPTFFVNGRIIPGSNMAELQRQIEKELKKSGV